MSETPPNPAEHELDPEEFGDSEPDDAVDSDDETDETENESA